MSTPSSASFRPAVSALLMAGFALFAMPALGSEEAPPAPAQPKKEEPKAEDAAEAKAENKNKAKPLTVTVVATQSEQETFDVPNQVDVIGDDEITHSVHSEGNFNDTFRELPGFSIQKTGHGQGSPFIRGLTGYHNLLMIDGVRFNNSTFRVGPMQYWATIDPLFLERVDVMRGPGSSLWGSDAVGGVVNAITKSTETWNSTTHQDLGNGVRVGGRAIYRFDMAERSNIGHVEFMGSHKDKVGWIFGGSYKDHDDFVGGGGSGGVQEYTGYEEYSLNGKVQYRPADHHELTFYVDRAKQNDVPRTQRTVYYTPWEGTSAGSDRRREFDQNRLLAYAKYRLDGMDGFVEELEATVSHQTQIEDQFRIDSSNRRRFDQFEVNVFGAQVRAASPSPIGRLTYGVDYYHEDVESGGKRFNQDGSLNRVELTGSVGDNASYDLLGLYIQDEAEVLDGFLTITGGGRFTWARANADKVNDPTLGKVAIDDQWSSFVGSLRFLIRPDRDSGDHWRAFAGVQQSFRAPSLHDLTSNDSTSVLEIPNTNQSLDPEQYTTYEIGGRTRYGGFTASASYYYTFIHNQLIRQPTGDLEDPLDPLSAPIVVRQNGGKGYLYGAELSMSFNFLEDFTAWGNVTWTDGALLDFVVDDEGPPVVTSKRRQAIRRIVPVMSHFGLKYEPVGKNWWVEAHGDVFGDADMVTNADASDNRVPPGGTPGFAVFGIRGGVKLVKEKLNITGAVRNIGNVDYRISGSGQNEPGVSFLLSLDFKF